MANIPPPPPGAGIPPPPPYEQAAHSVPQAPKKSRKGCLIGLGVMVVLLLGGCVALNQVINSIADGVGEEIKAIAEENARARDDVNSAPVTSASPDSGSAETVTSTFADVATETDPTAGTRANPWAYGANVPVRWDTFGDADDSLWATMIGEPRDITADVLAENPFNEPPPAGVVFAGFDASITLLEAGKEPLAPGFNFTWEIIAGATSAVYDATTIETEMFGCGVAPDEFANFSEVFVSGTLTGTVCIPIPEEDLGHPDTQVALKFSSDSRVVFSASGATEPVAPAAPPVPRPAAITDDASRDGSRSAPFAYDTAVLVTWDTFGDADNSVWSTTIGAPRDITDQILAENPFNEDPPEGVRFVGYEVSLTLVEAGKEPLSSGYNTTWEILGGSSARVYQSISLVFGCGVTPGEFDDFAEVFVGGTVSGTVCIPLPAEDLDHPYTHVAINIGDERVVFGP